MISRDVGIYATHEHNEFGKKLASVRGTRSMSVINSAFLLQLATVVTPIDSAYIQGRTQDLIQGISK